MGRRARIMAHHRPVQPRPERQHDPRRALRGDGRGRAHASTAHRHRLGRDRRRGRHAARAALRQPDRGDGRGRGPAAALAGGLHPGEQHVEAKPQGVRPPGAGRDAAQQGVARAGHCGDHRRVRGGHACDLGGPDGAADAAQAQGADGGRVWVLPERRRAHCAAGLPAIQRRHCARTAAHAWCAGVSHKLRERHVARSSRGFRVVPLRRRGLSHAARGVVPVLRRLRRDHLPRARKLLRRAARGGPQGEPPRGQLRALAARLRVEAARADADHPLPEQVRPAGPEAQERHARARLRA
ncbi:hypothetical protein IEO21_04429 [Rhodonia placenta]|uniref:Uncharacterized protein n=1 Tax=Rhodonia placenta TaxID=104341 RepID=A0A8H7P495_9APHY|nr:hypothetical protein IEO21_04429 [Postia placenta]